MSGELWFLPYLPGEGLAWGGLPVFFPKGHVQVFFIGPERKEAPGESSQHTAWTLAVSVWPVPR